MFDGTSTDIGRSPGREDHGQTRDAEFQTAEACVIRVVERAKRADDRASEEHASYVDFAGEHAEVRCLRVDRVE